MLLLCVVRCSSKVENECEEEVEGADESSELIARITADITLLRTSHTLSSTTGREQGSTLHQGSDLVTYPTKTAVCCINPCEKAPYTHQKICPQI